MTQEMQAAIERLQSLPEPDQVRVAPRINEYLTRLQHLRELVAEGLADIEHGDIVEWDAEAFKQQARQRGEARDTEAR